MDGVDPTAPATGSGAVLIGRTYTRGRRQPYLIRKWPGSNWALPMGPYTITQMLVFVGSVYLLLTYRQVWAHFGGLNLLIGVGVPAALTYATRHSRVEGRDPVRAATALAGLLLRPRAGYLGGGPARVARRHRWRAGAFRIAVPAGDHLSSAGAAGPPPPGPVHPWWVGEVHRGPSTDAARRELPGAGRWLADLVAELARRR